MNGRAGNARTWFVVLGLSLGPAVGNGFARFGYGLVLPAMRSDLAWTYAQAGWINTANALGYLIGALATLRLMTLIGPARLFQWGMALTAVSLCASGMTNDFLALLFWRLTAGIGGAPVFITGGVMVAAAFKSDASKNALAVALYFGGAGFGILLSAVVVPSILGRFGAPAWPLTWWALGLASFAALLPSWWSSRQADFDAPSTGTFIATQPPWGKLIPSLVGYLLFATGYIVYMTFLVAWMKENGATGLAIVATWAVLGFGVMLSPFLWRPLLASHASGFPLASACVATGVGGVLPLLIPNLSGQILSAAVFGLSFFIAPAAVTTFSKKNLPQVQWGMAVAMYTTVFAVGQTLGPVGAGWLADAVGNLSWGLTIAAAILFAGGLSAAFQPALSNPSTG